MGRCGAAWTASTYVHAPAAWARATISATGLIVPTAFDAQPTATSRVFGESSVVQAREIQRAVVEPRLPEPDRDAAVAGRSQPRVDVAWWSRPVRTISSPGAIVATIERLMWNVSVVMFGPNLISSGLAAPSMSAIACMGLGDDRVAPPAREERAVGVRVRLAVVARDRIDDRLRDLGAAGAVEEDDRPAVLLEREGREAGAERVDVEGGHRGPRGREVVSRS